MLTRCMEKGRVSAALAMWHFLCLCHSATARAYIVHVAASVCVCVCVHACARVPVCVEHCHADQVYGERKGGSTSALWHFLCMCESATACG